MIIHLGKPFLDQENMKVGKQFIIKVSLNRILHRQLHREEVLITK